MRDRNTRAIPTGANRGRPQQGPARTATAIVRIEESRRNAEMVLAEAALDGERFVSLMRLVTVAAFGLSQTLGTAAMGGTVTPSVPRFVGLGVYVALAVVAAIGVRRAKPNPRRAMVIPLLFTVFDFAFMGFMDWRDHLERDFHPELAAVSRGIVVCFAAVRFSLVHVAVAGALGIGTYLGAVALAGKVSPVAAPFTVAGLATLTAVIGWVNVNRRRMFLELRRRDNLSRFLPPPVVERVLSLGESSLAPVQREVTVLFADIRDFTALCEPMSPRSVLEFLDDYFGRMSQIVKGHDGLVNKFLGDGMLAFWGVPDGIPSHAEKALRAALDMRRALDEMNQERARMGLRPIRIGIGVHTGTVAAGMLGGADQHEYTIIGDAVNVASRVEGLTKRFGIDLLATEATCRQVDGRVVTRRLGEEQVKGRVAPVVVFAIDGLAEPPDVPSR